MASSLLQEAVLPGSGAKRTGSTTPTLSTPLQAIYTRPSLVAAMFRTTPPPEGICAHEKRPVFGSNRTTVFGFTLDSRHQTIPCGVLRMPCGPESCSPGEAHIFTAPVTRRANSPIRREAV